ncbi:P-loop NTPase fold protein [Dyella sp. ASV21]|uniref:P-loop NTPase fold protein n=1 Tax=Dyella sp. ASV21 TaxID=2795114 RepID=UPI0018EDDC0C|nr:P-loop NTPase fold protein [Dyella sp. ASV21]
MKAIQTAMKPPELAVFARFVAIGFVGAEIFRLSFYLGTQAFRAYSAPVWLVTATCIFFAALILTYGIARQAHAELGRMLKSGRIDLMLLLIVGVWTDGVAANSLEKLHAHVRDVGPAWAPLLLAAFSGVMLSSLVAKYWPIERPASQLVFLDDDEITDSGADFLDVSLHAQSFAEAVLASAAQSGLVFGVDGPWGVGKTSFTNLASRYWQEKAIESTLVFRFELLRYASEPDLPQRFLRELTAAIQKHAFAPEFAPVASRYAKALKGKAEFSFLGIKYSLEPSDETIDDMLQDIDDVLKRIRRKIIIVIDDLDRLDTKAVANVLFAIRRTFRLSHAIYILCYDTEILVGSDGDSENARAFLEKFVTVKLSLFVDGTLIQRFLERDWSSEESTLQTIPSETMVKLSSVRSKLSEILGGPMAASYMPMLGNIRKVKRFLNAVVLMQIERTELARTDFNRGDLINLMLLHLHFPGIFRQIYAEETEGRSGSFSVQRNLEGRSFVNKQAFMDFVDRQSSTDAKFLLSQLFDVGTLNFNSWADLDEAALSSRACFNQRGRRNLENYLKLIVRFVTPEPRDTFVLYKEAVDRVQEGMLIRSLLTERDFRLTDNDEAHNQFWSLLVNRASAFDAAVANDAIATLIEFLPNYNAVSVDGLSLRNRSIYSLVRLLDNAGWGRTKKRRLPNSPANVVEIAHRIFGTNGHEGRGILDLLSLEGRGVLGWHDLALFRLTCSWDRAGQLHNLQCALLLYEDANAETTGIVATLAVQEMRRISQEVFARFKTTFISTGRNFFAEVDGTEDGAFFGRALADFKIKQMMPDDADSTHLKFALAATRNAVKSFVIYQLSNSMGATGSGVGCGYYDEVGSSDGHGIAKLMNDYVFDVCFDLGKEENVHHFVTHLLSHLSNAFFSGGDEEGYWPTVAGLPGPLDPHRLALYWQKHRTWILEKELPSLQCQVVTGNYIATYTEDLPKVFAVLDDLMRTKLQPTGDAPQL